MDMRSPSPTPSERDMVDHKHDSDNEDAKSPDGPPYPVSPDDHQKLTKPSSFWPFERVFVGRRHGYRLVEQLVPTKSVCGKTGCRKMYCIPESHKDTMWCRTPRDGDIRMGAYMSTFPDWCPYCLTMVRQASARVTHECPGAPWPYSRATAHQREMAECFAMKKIDRRNGEADELLSKNVSRETSLIEIHLRWCAESCECKICEMHNNAKGDACIIVNTKYGNIPVTRPPILHEPPRKRRKMVHATTKTKTKTKSSHHKIASRGGGGDGERGVGGGSSKRVALKKQTRPSHYKIAWRDNEDWGGGGIGNAPIDGGPLQRKPWVLRRQPVQSRAYTGCKSVPLGDTGFVGLSGFE